MSVESRQLAMTGSRCSGYTQGMKTAVSIPDDLFAEADALAKDLRTSRSDLYSRALREYVARHSPDRVAEALDALFADGPLDGDSFAHAAALRTLKRAEW